MTTGCFDLASDPLAIVGKEVRKVGRSTRLTHGIVEAVGAEIYVNYGGLGVARFIDQIVVASRDPGVPFAAPGDSGSLVVDGFR